MAMSAASETRRLLLPVTFTTRAVPRCGPWAASGPGLIRPRSKARRPGPPPPFYYWPGLFLPGGDLLLVPLGGLAGGDLHAPADPVQQQVQPRQGVGHAEPAAHHLGDAGQRPALILIPPPAGRACFQHRLQLTDLGRGELAGATT